MAKATGPATADAAMMKLAKRLDERREAEMKARALLVRALEASPRLKDRFVQDALDALEIDPSTTTLGGRNVTGTDGSIDLRGDSDPIDLTD